MATKPQTVKGTRDFGPEQSLKRQYIFNTIKNHFERYGFSPIETPAMETLETLTGKYGEEGDRLIFKILNSGDFKRKVSMDMWGDETPAQIIPKITEKALRYDLTVPFARFVTMHRNDIAFPFRRYQIQPVWRADRPQKGRYREFYQCDADIIGSDSLVLEAELVSLFCDVLKDLKIPDFSILINNRKILAGLAEAIGHANLMIPMTVALDKLDKIGITGVEKELLDLGISQKGCGILQEVMRLSGGNDGKLDALAQIISNTELGKKGLDELQETFAYAKAVGADDSTILFNPTLARGLNYYTGAIFEVTVANASVGSICGGGRYDDLTGIFGMPGISGIGISFGADRIYDVLTELDLFPSEKISETKVLITRFEGVETLQLLNLLHALRKSGIAAEIYPDVAKMKKQFKYANDKAIPFVIVAGPSEMEKSEVSIKEMVSGNQHTIALNKVIEKMKEWK